MCNGNTKRRRKEGWKEGKKEGGRERERKGEWARGKEEKTVEIFEIITAERNVSKINDRHQTTDPGKSESTKQDKS